MEERDSTVDEPRAPAPGASAPAASAPAASAPAAPEGQAPEGSAPHGAVPEVEETDEADLAQDAAAEAPEDPDYRDLYLRAAAEAENIRKRARRDVEAATARGVARLARELLPSLDNLDRALAAAEAEDADSEHHLTKGIRLVQQELLGALTRVGIEAYSPAGEAFDPHQHEAVAQQPADGAESGVIITVYQPGYRYKDEVLRAAKVVVAA